MSDQAPQPTPDIPAGVDVTPPFARKPSHKGLIILILILLVIAAGAAAYFFMPHQLRTSIEDQVSSLHPSDELQHLRFITGTDAAHLSLSGFGLGAAKPISYSAKTFLEVVSAKGVIYALLKDASGKIDAYRIPEQGDPIPLTTDGRAKQSLSISPDGSRIAFSYINALPNTVIVPEGVNPVNIFTFDRYEIAVASVASSTVTTYGAGLYAHFTDNNTLFYASQKGFNLLHLDTEKNEFSRDTAQSRMFRDPVYLTSDEFVYYDPVVKRFYTMKIAHDGGQLVVNLVKINTTMPPDIHSLTSNGDGVLYGLYGDRKSNVTLIRITGDKVTELIHLPVTFEPRDLVYVQ